MKVRTQDAKVHIIDAQKARDLKEKGYTKPEIAETLGCSRSTVARALRMTRRAA